MNDRTRLRSRPWLGAAWLVLGLTLAFGPAAGADDAKKNAAEPKKDEAKKAKTEKFETTTIDGVNLVGDFYPSDKNKNAAVVILLHAVGDPKRTGASRKDFGKLPEMLQKEGYAVVAFDFRGYGDSKDIKADYWKLHPLPRPLPGGRLPTRIEAKDWRTVTDFAMLGNDLNAVKDWLILKNNAMECNSANICLIGAEQGAMVGLLWATNEYTDPLRVKGDKFGGKPEGEDISCFIWLSMRPALGNEYNRMKDVAENWMKLLYTRVNTFALHGEKDKASADFWKEALTWIKPEKEKERYDSTGVKTLPKTEFQGAKLLGLTEILGQNQDTETFILAYLKAHLPNNKPWRERKDNDRLPTLIPINRLGLPAPR